MAPEVFSGTYGLPCDVYSYGNVLWELVTRRRPWDEIDSPIMFPVMTNVMRGKRPELLNKEEAAARQGGGGLLLDLMRDCWATVPRDRPRFAEVLGRLRRAGGDGAGDGGSGGGAGGGDAEAGGEAKHGFVQGFDFE